MSTKYDVFNLMAHFEQSSLTQFELADGDFSLKLQRGHAEKDNETVPLSALVASPSVQNVVVDTPVEMIADHAVKSPLVGVVYLQSGPDQPAFKKVGDTVRKGEVICIIEAMKVMNEIQSDCDGVITEILVTNEQVVDFEQPLFYVKEGV